MRFYTIYDPGTCAEIEDALEVRPPLAVVIDGVSAPHSQSNPSRRFVGNRSGGAMVADVLAAEFRKSWDQRLEYILQTANQTVSAIQQHAGASLKCSDQLAGAAFASIRVYPRNVEVIQCGDCFACWLTRDGRTHVTANQVQRHDREAAELRRTAMERTAKQKGINLDRATPTELADIRSAMWEQTFEAYATLRRRHVNQRTSGGFGLLNGQPTFLEHCTSLKLPRNSLVCVILGSDGIAPLTFISEGHTQKTAHAVMSTYDAGGLKRLLHEAQAERREMASRSWVDLPEATAVAIEF